MRRRTEIESPVYRIYNLRNVFPFLTNNSVLLSFSCSNADCVFRTRSKQKQKSQHSESQSDPDRKRVRTYHSILRRHTHIRRDHSKEPKHRSCQTEEQQKHRGPTLGLDSPET